MLKLTESQNFVNPGFNLSLSKISGFKIQTYVKHNRTSIIKTPGLILQNYPNPGFYKPQGLNLFVIPA